MSETEFSRLAAFMRRCGFFDWDAEYADAMVTDQPTYVITAKDGESDLSLKSCAIALQRLVSAAGWPSSIG